MKYKSYRQPFDQVVDFTYADGTEGTFHGSRAAVASFIANQIRPNLVANNNMAALVANGMTANVPPAGHGVTELDILKMLTANAPAAGPGLPDWDAPVDNGELGHGPQSQGFNAGDPYTPPTPQPIYLGNGEPLVGPGLPDWDAPARPQRGRGRGPGNNTQAAHAVANAAGFVGPGLPSWDN